MSEVLQFRAEEDLPERLDKWLGLRIPGLSRSALQKLISQGRVGLNGKVASKSDELSFGDYVSVEITDPAPLDIEPEDIPLSIVYEDEYLLVVDKPKGMVVHPAQGNYSGTLVNALLYHCGDSLSGINGVLRPGIVHRIDKDTSGLLVVAKNDFAHTSLASQIGAHTVTRRYSAIVYGSLKEEKGTIALPIGRSRQDRKKMAVYKNPQPDIKVRGAVTHYEVLRRFDGFSELSLNLETGRTHQIRVHMAAIGHPVAGDPLYGPKKCITSLGGQCLHAGVLGFVHPKTGEYMEFKSPLPTYYLKFVAGLREI